MLTPSTDTSLTFFPKRYSDPIEGPLYQQADLRDSIFNEINVDLTRQCENALDLAALAALHAVSVLIDRSSHPNLEIFRIFEEAISVLVSLLRAAYFRSRLTFAERLKSSHRPSRPFGQRDSEIRHLTMSRSRIRRGQSERATKKKDAAPSKRTAITHLRFSNSGT